VATYAECDGMCQLAKAACPESDVGACTNTCHQQADTYAETGHCASELYKTAACVNDTQTVADVTCLPNGVKFAGCQVERAAYNACVAVDSATLRR